MIRDFDPTEFMEGAVDDDDAGLDFVGDEEDDENFTPHLDLDEMINACDVTAAEIAELGRAKMCSFLDIEAKEDPNALARWTQAVEALFEICQRKEEIGYQDLSVRTFNAIDPKNRIDKMGATTQIAWDAVTRYMCSLIMAEDREEFDAFLEFDWHGWILERQQKPKEANDE